MEYTNETVEVFKQIVTVPANGNFVITDLVLSETSVVTGTLRQQLGARGGEGADCGIVVNSKTEKAIG